MNSIVVKILGQKNETTTKSNYQNASLAAKLNYLETEIGNLKTKVEISGGTPKCSEAGTFLQSPLKDVTKTFTGPGELYMDHYLIPPITVVDGVTVTWDLYVVNGGTNPVYRIQFHDQCILTYNYSNIVDKGYNAYIRYIYYKY